MSLLENAIYRLVNGKKTITGPMFLKDFEKENEQLKDLLELSNKVTSAKKDIIDRDIAFLKHGLKGEENVYYELKNSFLPIVCLHDIRLEYENYSAQFDFIIISNKFIYILETKKLNGDIDITSDGDFIRTIKDNYGKVIKKEGMYSPISQNERHVNILKEILIKECLVKTLPIKSAVIIANPKTIINKYRAPKYIQNNIFKYDQVRNLLDQELNDKNNEKNLLEKYIYELADFLLEHNKPIKIDYTAKYSLTEEDFKNTTNIAKETHNESISNCDYDSILYEKLRKYRLEISKAENIKPYMVFNNKELDDLLLTKPTSKEELLKVKGFGEKKVEKYGTSILSIINS